MTYKPDKNNKCTFQKMGANKNLGRKKSDKTLTPKERAKIKVDRLREFRKWFGKE